jgi:hypothetical protein
LIKEELKKFDAKSIGVKVRDKILDAYSKINLLYTEKAFMKIEDYDKEGNEILKKLSEITRLCIRVFLQ